MFPDLRTSGEGLQARVPTLGTVARDPPSVRPSAALPWSRRLWRLTASTLRDLLLP